MQPRRRSPWKPVGVGCAALALAALIAFVAFLFVGHRMARAVRATMADPSLRAETAREVLHAAHLPEGFHSTLVASVPLLGRVVVLEGPPTALAGEGLIGPSRLFLYLEKRGTGPTGTWVEDLDRLLDVRGLDIEAGQPVGDGNLGTLTFRAMRGTLRRRPSGEWPVIAALLDFRCRNDDGVARFGVWIEADPTPPPFADQADLSGTPADPTAIRRLTSTFHVCP